MLFASYKVCATVFMYKICAVMYHLGKRCSDAMYGVRVHGGIMRARTVPRAPRRRPDAKKADGEVGLSRWSETESYENGKPDMRVLRRSGVRMGAFGGENGGVSEIGLRRCTGGRRRLQPCFFWGKADCEERLGVFRYPLGRDRNRPRHDPCLLYTSPSPRDCS